MTRRTRRRFSVERTLGTVLCECPPPLCPHPSGYREVSEYVVVDRKTDRQMSDLFDRYADAKRAADAMEAQ